MYPWLCAAKVYTGFGKGVRQFVSQWGAGTKHQ